MSKNSVVSLTLQLKGQQVSQELKRIATDQLTAVKKINTEQQKLAPIQAGQINTAKKVSDELRKQGQAFTAQKREALALDTARKLGIRTEQQISAEIKKTHSTYAQLSILQRQGVVTVKDMERAYVAMKSRVAALNGELGKTLQTEKQIQQIQKSGGSGGLNLIQRGGLAAGATVAGGAIISSALQKPRDYDQQLTYITATATGGQGMLTADRLKSITTLDGYIKQAVRNGGGTREDAAEAANALIASGKYDLNTVSPALNTAVKTAFSTGAAAKDAATLTVRMQDFGLTDLQKGHDIAVRGAQLGSFEYKDQAKWLAQQMAAAKAAGYSGEKGFVELVAMNQVAMSTAATTDEGGNNLVNLLGKLSSTDFSNAVAKAVENTAGLPTKAIKNKKGKVVGQEFDWATYSISEREKGVYGVDAFVKLLERQLSSNTQYQDLQKKIANTTDNEQRKSILEDMSNIASGSQLGEFLADRQALMAALAVYYKKEELSKIKGILPTAGGTVASEYDFVSQREWVKNQAADQEKLFAQSKAYDSVSETLGKVKENITDWAQKHEELAASAYKASVALTAVAAIGVGGAVLSRGKGSIPDLPDGTKTKGKPNVKVGNGLKAAGLAGLAYTGYELFQPLDDYIYSSLDKIRGGSGERPDFVQQAIDKSIAAQSQQNAELISQQQQANKLSQDMIGKLSSLISVTQQNKPLPFSASGLLGDISNHAAAEEKRQGAFIPWKIAPK